jgi:hypothetical protein
MEWLWCGSVIAVLACLWNGRVAGLGMTVSGEERNVGISAHALSSRCCGMFAAGSITIRRGAAAAA